MCVRARGCFRVHVLWDLMCTRPTCAAEECVAEVGHFERGNGAEHDTHGPADARDDASVSHTHMAELEWVDDGQQPLYRHHGQHKDGHLAVG